MSDPRPLFPREPQNSTAAAAPRFLGRAVADAAARPVAAFASRAAPSAGRSFGASMSFDQRDRAEALDGPAEPPPKPVCGQTCREHSGALEQGIESLHQHSEVLAMHARQDAIAIGVELAMRIVGRELRDSVEPLLGFVESALARMADSRHITIRVSPRDMDAMAPRVASLTSKPTMARIDVVQDTGLGCGECRVESELGSIDGRLATRVAALLRAMEAELGPSGPEGGAGTP